MNWLTGWENAERVELTIDSSKVDADLAWFPVRIYINSSSGITSIDATGIISLLGSNWRGLAITTADGTMCFIDVSLWDVVNNKIVLDVAVPVVAGASDTVLYMYIDSTKNNSVMKDATKLNDTFTGTNGDAINIQKWLKNYYGDTPSTDSIQSNKWSIVHTSVSTSTGSYLQTRFVFIGDFDVQVEFDTLSTGTAANNCILLSARSHPNRSRDNFSVKAVYVSGAKWSTDGYYNGTNITGGTTSRTNTYGGLRIIRRADILYSLIKDGAGAWTAHSSQSNWINAPLYLSVGIYSATGSTSVNIDNFTVNDFIKFSGYIGNSQKEAVPYSACQVWDKDFAIVTHFNSDPGAGSGAWQTFATLRNGSCDTPIGWTYAGTMTTGDLIDTAFGKGLQMDGTDDYVGTTDYLYSNLLTFEAAINLDDYNKINNIWLKRNASGTTDSSASPEWSFAVSSGLINVAGWDASASPGVPIGVGNTDCTGGTAIGNGEDRYVAGRLGGNGGVMNVWLDAAQDSANVSIDKTMRNSTNVLQIGCRSASNNARFFKGTISEGRLSICVRADAWLKATYYTLFDNLVTFGKFRKRINPSYTRLARVGGRALNG